MMLVEETQVPLAALPVTQFRTHLRLGTGFADDSLQDSVLEGFLRAALAAVEARTGKVLIERSFSWSMAAWSKGDGLGLPLAPVSAVTELALVNRFGDETVVSSGGYRLVADTHRPMVRAVGAALPMIPSEGQAVVRFVAGFGADWDDVPADLRQAVMLLAAHYYEYRDETKLGGGCMPFGVTSLLERYRPLRLGLEGAV